MVTASPPIPAERASDYRYCQRLARDHYENFPVASLLLPPAMRPHVAAVYAFARVADDFADEGEVAAAERHARLEGWRARLWRAASGDAGGDDEYAPLFRALANTIAACRLPASVLDDLLKAFEQDVDVSRYRTWSDLLDYCQRSANPVGRLVLRIAGVHDEALDRSSDALCTALQLTNFWQDLGRDFRVGRIYVPQEDQREFDAREEDLALGAMTPEWRAVIERMVSRTNDLYEEGREVCDRAPGRLRFELRATWLGGRRILERIEALDYDTLRERPALSRADAPALAWRVLRWRGRS